MCLVPVAIATCVTFNFLASAIFLASSFLGEVATQVLASLLRVGQPLFSIQQI